jgi:hypothetical protein
LPRKPSIGVSNAPYASTVEAREAAHKKKERKKERKFRASDKHLAVFVKERSGRRRASMLNANQGNS